MVNMIKGFFFCFVLFVVVFFCFFFVCFFFWGGGGLFTCHIPEVDVMIVELMLVGSSSVIFSHFSVGVTKRRLDTSPWSIYSMHMV